MGEDPGEGPDHSSIQGGPPGRWERQSQRADGGRELSLQEAADSRPCPKRLGQESDCPCTRAASGEEIRTPKRRQSRV